MGPERSVHPSDTFARCHGGQAMAYGLKFWHGNMVAQQVFPLRNEFYQLNDPAGFEGICTAASLFWCRKCLELRRGVNSFAEIGKSQHNLNIIMTTLRQLDNNPAAQTDLAGLQIVGGDRVVSSMAEVARVVKGSASGVAIFWNSYHTMGFRYSHHEKELFDMNFGLYRSKYTKGIEANYYEHYAGADDQVIGCRIVSL
jgi:hypothetical protein